MGGVLVFLIALAMLVFILMGDFNRNNQMSSRGEGVATVNGHLISYDAFNDRLDANEVYMQRQMVQMGQLKEGETLSDMQLENVKQSTLNELMNEQLKADVYSNLGIELGKEEKVAMLFDENFQNQTIASSFRGQNGKFDAELLKNYLNTLDAPDKNFAPGEKRQQWANFEQAIFKERLDQKYNKLIQKSTKVPTWMAESLYKNDNTTVNFEYVMLPYADVKDEEVKVTDSELNSYLKKHENEFKQNTASVSFKYMAYPILPSAGDIQNVENWMNEKFAAWKTAEYDSLFIMSNSESKWDQNYYLKSEISNPMVDSLFAMSSGSYVGPINTGKEDVAYKLIDKKPIPDSVQVRHLLLSGDNLQSQEDVDKLFALRDSLMRLVDTLGVPLSSLTAQFSADQSNAGKGGDLGWVRPSEMVQQFNDLIFYDMKPGDIKTVGTQFGVHIVQVYGWGSTQTGIKYATLNRSIFPSEETSGGIFTEAATFAGNNRNKEDFTKNGGNKVRDAVNLTTTSSIVPGLPGNGRELIKWAYNAKVGEVSSPIMVGDNFVVAIVSSKNEKGETKLENVRALVEAAVMKEKKAELLKAKMNGSDLASIASTNKKSVGTANSMSFANILVQGVGNEGDVVGTALGTKANTLSKPVAGEAGVFVVKPLAVTAAPQAADLNTYKNRASNYAGMIQGRLFEAMKEAADVKDHSFDFF
ncbi:MAG: peptidylprolyl isomerase [Chitinophagales bacterium]|nr:peptidylprolyl isomerase [Chitinophagales bacterium]